MRVHCDRCTVVGLIAWTLESDELIFVMLCGSPRLRGVQRTALHAPGLLNLPKCRARACLTGLRRQSQKLGPLSVWARVLLGRFGPGVACHESLRGLCGQMTLFINAVPTDWMLLRRLFTLGVFMAGFFELGNNSVMIFSQWTVWDKDTYMQLTPFMDTASHYDISHSASDFHWSGFALAINWYLEPQQLHLQTPHDLILPDFDFWHALTDDTLEATTEGRLQGLQAPVSPPVISASMPPQKRVVADVLVRASEHAHPSTTDLGDTRLLRPHEVCPGREWKIFRRRAPTCKLRRHRWMLLAGYVHVMKEAWAFLLLRCITAQGY